MSLELKIKSKHLAVEASIIRHEERKLKRQIAWAKKVPTDCINLLVECNSLTEHRRQDVRNENRATYLARAYIAGKPYKLVEDYRKEENEHKFRNKIVPKVLAMVKKYSNPNLDTKHIEVWIDVE